MADKIGVEEWLAELQRVSGRSDDGLTSAEGAEKMGLSVRTTLLKIKKAYDMGWVKVGKRKTMTLDGRPDYTPVYQVVNPKERRK